MAKIKDSHYEKLLADMKAIAECIPTMETKGISREGSVFMVRDFTNGNRLLMRGNALRAYDYLRVQYDQYIADTNQLFFATANRLMMPQEEDWEKSEDGIEDALEKGASSD